MFDATTVNMIWEGLLQTLYMTVLSTVLAYVIGLPLGVLLVTSAKDGIAPRPVLYKVLDVIVNIMRSIPFLILLIAIMPLTRLIVGTTMRHSFITLRTLTSMVLSYMSSGISRNGP